MLKFCKNCPLDRIHGIQRNCPFSLSTVISFVTVVSCNNHYYNHFTVHNNPIVVATTTQFILFISVANTKTYPAGLQLP